MRNQILSKNFSLLAAFMFVSLSFGKLGFGQESTLSELERFARAMSAAKSDPSPPNRMPKFNPRLSWNQAVKSPGVSLTITVPQTQSNINRLSAPDADWLRARMLKGAQKAFGNSIASVRETGADVYIGSEKVGNLLKGELLHVGEVTSDGWVGVSRVDNFPFAWMDRKQYRLSQIEGWVNKDSLILMSQAKDAPVYEISDSRINQTFGTQQIPGRPYYSNQQNYGAASHIQRSQSSVRGRQIELNFGSSQIQSESYYPNQEVRGAPSRVQRARSGSRMRRYGR